MKRVYTVLRWAVIFALVTVFGLFVNEYGFEFSVVNGTSMEPTLKNGDRLFINKWYFMISEPNKGDVITFEDPREKGRYLVKRVVGVPGDTIEIVKGALYVNGEPIHEAYVDAEIEDGNFGPVKVKPGTVFVMGDNRHKNASRDSRSESIGLVPFKLLEGKVQWIIWRPSLMAHL